MSDYRGLQQRMDGAMRATRILQIFAVLFAAVAAAGTAWAVPVQFVFDDGFVVSHLGRPFTVPPAPDPLPIFTGASGTFGYDTDTAIRLPLVGRRQQYALGPDGFFSVDVGGFHLVADPSSLIATFFVQLEGEDTIFRLQGTVSPDSLPPFASGPATVEISTTDFNVALFGRDVLERIPESFPFGIDRSVRFDAANGSAGICCFSVHVVSEPPTWPIMLVAGGLWWALTRRRRRDGGHRSPAWRS